MHSQRQFYRTFKSKIIRIVSLPKERVDMTGSITATDKSPRKLVTCKPYIAQIHSLLFCQSLPAITEKYYKNALPSLIKSTLRTFYVRDISSYYINKMKFQDNSVHLQDLYIILSYFSAFCFSLFPSILVHGISNFSSGKTLPTTY